jgi:hypothetical protein
MSDNYLKLGFCFHGEIDWRGERTNNAGKVVALPSEIWRRNRTLDANVHLRACDAVGRATINSVLCIVSACDETDGAALVQSVKSVKEAVLSARVDLIIVYQVECTSASF